MVSPVNLLCIQALVGALFFGACVFHDAGRKLFKLDFHFVNVAGAMGYGANLCEFLRLNLRLAERSIELPTWVQGAEGRLF